MRSKNLVNLILIAIMLILAITPVLASSIEKKGETEGWILNYELSSGEAEPISTVTLNVTIKAKVVNYNFELTVNMDHFYDKITAT